MTSNDNQQFLTVDVYKSELGEIRTDIRSGFELFNNEFKNVHSEILSVREIAIINSAKIDAYRDFNSIWFTVIAVIIAIVGVMATLAPMFRDARHEHRDKDTHITRAEVQDMINSSISQMVNDAVSEALGKVGK